MGIITLAVICNIKASIKNTKEILTKLDEVSQTNAVAFRNPFDKSSHKKQVEEAKKSMTNLLIELEKALAREMQYCTEIEYLNYVI